jgi:hypothetical protein
MEHYPLKLTGVHVLTRTEKLLCTRNRHHFPSHDFPFSVASLVESSRLTSQDRR